MREREREREIDRDFLVILRVIERGNRETAREFVILSERDYSD